MVGPCGHSNQPSGSIYGREYLSQLSSRKLIEKDSFCRASCLFLFTCFLKCRVTPCSKVFFEQFVNISFLVKELKGPSSPSQWP
jgi:hypothetical protein